MILAFECRFIAFLFCFHLYFLSLLFGSCDLVLGILSSNLFASQ
jgi:hypothetical protein